MKSVGELIYLLVNETEPMKRVELLRELEMVVDAPEWIRKALEERGQK